MTLQRVRSHITRVYGDRKGARPARGQPERPQGLVHIETLDASRCVSLYLAGHPYDLRGSRIPHRWMVSRQPAGGLGRKARVFWHRSAVPRPPTIAAQPRGIHAGSLWAIHQRLSACCDCFVTKRLMPFPWQTTSICTVGTTFRIFSMFPRASS